MSATGSVTIAIVTVCLRSSPRRLGDAGQVAFVRLFSEADAAHREFAQIAARPAALEATVMLPHFELRLALALLDQAGLSHQAALPSLRSGMPISSRNANASSSVCADVTITMSMPRTASTLS